MGGFVCVDEGDKSLVGFFGSSLLFEETVEKAFHHPEHVGSFSRLVVGYWLVPIPGGRSDRIHGGVMLLLEVSPQTGPSG